MKYTLINTLGRVSFSELTIESGTKSVETERISTQEHVIKIDA